MPDWSLVRTLFDDVIAAPEDDRETLLTQATPDVRREVEDLLRAHEARGKFDALAEQWTPALGDWTSSLTAPPDNLVGIGDRVGAYRLLRPLGQGGMGEVYLATRDDGVFEREVALKLLRAGLVSPEARARFEQERHVLARLDHPGIARLLDGGIAPDGRAYFVMEAVDGESLDAYCETRDLGVADRVRLVTTVAEAVAHAHQRLVVHRDLKPSNILVAEREGAREKGEGGGASSLFPSLSAPSVKLLDFGIARLLENDTSAPATRVLTPEYAAPEQLSGGTISTATDVYGLGVALYELLTGQRPFARDDRPLTEWVEALQHERPPPPSEVASDRLPRGLRRDDLDTICLTALDPDPAQRYASAAALADDLRRWTDGLPIAARPATTRYLVRRFVARHRRVVAGAVLAGLALVLALVGMTVQAQRASAEAIRAQAEARKAEQVGAFLESILAAADPYSADAVRPGVPVETVVRQASRRVDRELAAEPEVRAEVHQTLALAFEGLGLYPEAAPHHRAALALRDSLYAPAPHPDRIETLDRYSVFLRARGQVPAADSLRALSLALRRERFGEGSLQYAESLNLLVGETPMHRRGPHTEALLREALAIAEARAGPESIEAGIGHHTLAVHLGVRGATDEAEMHFRRAESIGQKWLTPDDPLMAVVWQDWAAVRLFAGDIAQAETYVRRARTIREDRFPPSHPSRAEADALYAVVLLERGKPEEAEPLLREAITALEAQAIDSWVLPAMRAGLGAAIAAQGRAEEAGPLLTEGLAEVRQRLTDAHGWTRYLAAHLADLYEAQGREAEARPFRRLANGPLTP
ncbi:MAG: serine/threonine-protein kinase [Bacteroidota bacterium]